MTGNRTREQLRLVKSAGVASYRACGNEGHQIQLADRLERNDLGDGVTDRPEDTSVSSIFEIEGEASPISGMADQHP